MAKKRKKRNFGWKAQIFLILLILLCVLFSSVAVLMIVGMIPTVVALIVDRTEGRMRAVTVGAINFAGCAPFMIEVFKRGNNLELAINYIVQPRTIVVMYFAAAIGYVLDWALTGIVSSIMVQKQKRRLTAINEEKQQLIERWGDEVTGTIPLDEYGFPKKDDFAQAEAEPVS